MIDRMNTHYSFTNPATIHDEEALTTLELVGRQGAKINEVIDSQNVVLEDVEHQKSVVIPQTIKEDVENHINNGDFDNQIDAHTKELINQIEEVENDVVNRLDNLLGSLEVGSTTSDAELIDMRVDIHGKSYPSAGNSLRTQIANLDMEDKVIINDINQIVFKPNLHNPLKFDESGYYDESGKFSNLVDGYGNTGFISCEGLKTLYRSKQGYTTFWDKNFNFIGVSTTGQTITTPENCAYISVALHKNENNEFVLCYTENKGFDKNFLFEGVKVTDKNLEQSRTFKTLQKMIKYETNNMYDAQSYNDTFFFNYTDGLKTVMKSYGSTGFIECEPQTEYRRNKNGYITFWDENFNFISGLDNNFVFTTPANAKYMNFAVHNDFKDEFYVVKSSEVYVDKYTIMGAGSPLFGFNYGALGDSITYGLNATVSYGEILSEDNGLSFTNYGISGGRLASTSHDSVTQPMCVRYEDMDDNLDIITVMGGTNDCASQVPIGANTDTDITTFKGALNVLCRGLLEKYVGKRIGFITPIQRANNTGIIKQEEYVDAMKEICSLYSIPVLDLYRESGICTIHDTNANGLLSDGLHPSDEGQRVIARKVKHFIETL